MGQKKQKRSDVISKTRTQHHDTELCQVVGQRHVNELDMETYTEQSIPT